MLGAPAKVAVFVGEGLPGKAEVHQQGQLKKWELPRALNLEEEISKLLKWNR